MVSRAEGAQQLGISVAADRSTARAAMLCRLHELIATEGHEVDSPMVQQVEQAYKSFISGEQLPRPQRAAPATPRISPTPEPFWSLKSPRMWVVILFLLMALAILVIIVASSMPRNQDSSSNNGGSQQETTATPASPTARPSPSRDRPTIDSGVTGQVGTCWAESFPGSEQYRKISCNSAAADVVVVREARSPEICRSGYFDNGDGWYLCLANK